jgi:hypothetical protein
MTRSLPASLYTLVAALLLAACLSLPAFAQEESAHGDDPAASTEPAEGTAPTEAPPADPGTPAEKVQHTCIVTGMPWEASPTRVEAVFNVDGELLRGYFVNLAYMYLLRDSLVADGSLVEIAQVKMLDYATYGTDHEEMILVDKLGGNIHLDLVEESLPNTKAPFIIAFTSEDTARDAIDRDHGRFHGEYLPWGRAVSRILEALHTDPKEQEPSAAMGE